MNLKGYTTFSDAARELGEVVDVLWRSGTRMSCFPYLKIGTAEICEIASLQIPYLLQIALSTSSYLPSFPPSPLPTFTLLKKLDHAFVSLITGKDKVTGEILPGFDSEGGGLSRTDMVRLRSLVLDTRVVIVSVMSRKNKRAGSEGEETEPETETDGDMSVDIEEESGFGMEVGQVYEATIEQLNLALGDGFGIVG